MAIGGALSAPPIATLALSDVNTTRAQRERNGKAQRIEIRCYTNQFRRRGLQLV